MGDTEPLTPDEAETYLRITKLREAAEEEHGRETMARVTEEYRQLRERLQAIPHLPHDERRDVQRQCARLEATYGYEVLAGVPNITRGNHPRHDWSLGAPDQA